MKRSRRVRSFKGEFCHDVGTINLATGDVGWALTGCLGAAPLDQIGDVEIDPRAEITCTAPLQTCEIDWNEEAWNPDRCMPWPPESEPEAPTTGEPMSGSSEDSSEGGSEGSSESSAGEDDPVDQGCACDGGDAGEPGLLGLIALLGLGLAPRRAAGVRER